MIAIYYLYAGISIVLAGISQTLLKIGARKDDKPLGVYLNMATMAGYFLFFIVTICSTCALKGLELKFFYALASLNYVVVLILSKIVLKEGLSRNKIVASCLIVVGVIVFNL